MPEPDRCVATAEADNCRCQLGRRDESVNILKHFSEAETHAFFSSLKMSRSHSARASSFFKPSSLSSNTTPPVTALLIRRYGMPAFVSMTPLFACVLMSAYAPVFHRKTVMVTAAILGTLASYFLPSLAWKMSLLKMQMWQLLLTSLRHYSGGSPCSPANHPKATAGLKGRSIPAGFLRE